MKNDDGVRQIIREKVLLLKNDKGVSFAYIATRSGIKRWDVAHFAKNNRRIRQDKFDKLKEFILNY